MKSKLVALSILIITAAFAVSFFNVVVQQPVSASLAVDQLDDSEFAAAKMRSYQSTSASIPLIAWSFVVVVGVFIFRKELASITTKKTTLVLAAISVLTTTGCWRPYDTPEFVEIQHHETGYLIPLEGANKEGQKKFDSEEALEENRVAIKRIEIPHRWVQTSYWSHVGEYMDTVRMVVVDRSPITREWTADKSSGTSASDEAIWLESKDSIGFSLGFNCTSFIDESDSTKFLYWYPTTSPDATASDVDKSITGLAHTMDKEVRARVQMLANHVAAQYDLDDLRSRKQEILNVVRNGVANKESESGGMAQERLEGTIEHFKKRGITITNLGQFGGFEYEEAEIQKAINETFISQQEKVKTAAAFEAQGKKNEQIELEAEAIANKERTIAKGKGDAVTIAAQAEASAIKLVAAAASEAGKDPLFLSLKKLEVENGRIKKWDGQYPKTMFGGSAMPNLLMQLPQDE